MLLLGGFNDKYSYIFHQLGSLPQLPGWNVNQHLKAPPHVYYIYIVSKTSFQLFILPISHPPQQKYGRKVPAFGIQQLVASTLKIKVNYISGFSRRFWVQETMVYLDVPDRKLVSKCLVNGLFHLLILLINGVYWGYNPLTSTYYNHLLTSWSIQVPFARHPNTYCFGVFWYDPKAYHSWLSRERLEPENHPLETSLSRPGPWDKSLNGIFFLLNNVIPQRLEFSHWLSEKRNIIFQTLPVFSPYPSSFWWQLGLPQQQRCVKSSMSWNPGWLIGSPEQVGSYATVDGRNHAPDCYGKYLFS